MEAILQLGNREHPGRTRTPAVVVSSVLAICVLPFVLTLMGFDFGSHARPFNAEAAATMGNDELVDAMFHHLSGAFTHTVLEWSAFCVAIITVILAFSHYRITGDVTTPIIGMALFCAGCMDAFHTLAADRLIEAVADNHNLIPFTWAISRTFNAAIMIFGVGILLSSDIKKLKTDTKLIVIMSLLFGMLAYGIIHYCANSNNLPRTMYPDSFITRPWDVAPLVLFLFAGLFVYPKFYRKYPSLFAHTLIISAIPMVALEAYMAFGSVSLYDNYFNIAHFLKLIAYLVPLTGLVLDYVKTYQEEKLLANHDLLTGLPNRGLFYDRLSHDIAVAQRQSQLLGVLFIDLDRFKIINDSLGHDAGDELLRVVARRLEACLRSSDTVARLGGDEFVCILHNMTHAEDAAIVSRKLIDSISESVLLNQKEVFVSSSIGISIYPDTATDVDSLLQSADTAMYEAKHLGNGAYCFYDSNTSSACSRQLEIDSLLHAALGNREFELNYQPIVDAHTNKIVAAEALLRWYCPEHGQVSPLEFIPIAEKNGMIVPLGRQVLLDACRQAVEWQKKGLSPIRVNVNVSPRQLEISNFVITVKQVLAETGLSPEYLGLEITEGLLISDLNASVEILNELRQLGVYILLDDFGTGYSSLSYLRRLPIHAFKIDRSFIQGITGSRDDQALLDAIIAIGSALSLNIVAEGVETDDQVKLLAKHSNLDIQGYYYSTPVTADAFGELLVAGFPPDL